MNLICGYASTCLAGELFQWKYDSILAVWRGTNYVYSEKILLQIYVEAHTTLYVSLNLTLLHGLYQID